MYCDKASNLTSVQAKFIMIGHRMRVTPYLLTLLTILAGLIGQTVATGVVNDTMCAAYSATDSDEYW